MEDQRIIELFWSRDEQAIVETAKKYSGYCRSIATNILRNQSDVEECLNDTWLRTWDSLPPQRPNIFPVYLGTITRNLSLGRLRHNSAQKRSPVKSLLSFDDIQETVSDNHSVENEIRVQELGRAMDRFLRNLSPKDRCIFLRKYWYMDTIAEIAARCHTTSGSIKANLYRTRNKLKTYLEQEGYDL